MAAKLKKTDDEWQKALTPEQYKITRQAGTEPPFSGDYVHHFDKGLYRCICCQQPLFSSSAKFDSSCGWPSFDAHVSLGVTSQHLDVSHGMERTEVRCHYCDAHLGHIFDDGPTDTGLRYCINSTSLDFHDDK